MATGIEELVDILFGMIDEAKNAAFSGDKCIIERDRALDILDDIKEQFPVELAEARKIVNARNEYVAAAKREAEDIRRRAEIEAKQMVDTDEVMNLAKKQAADLMRDTENKCRELRRSTNEYCADLLRRAEEAMEEATNEARRTRTAFCSAANMSAKQDTPPAKNSRMFDVEAEG